MDVFDHLFNGIVIVLGLVLSIAALPVALPIAGVVLLVRWLIRRSRGDNALPAGSAKAYAYLDDTKATPESVAKVVLPFEEDTVLGPYAKGVLGALNKAELRRKGIYAVLEEEFEKATITWDKFSVPVDKALDRIVHKAAQLANLIQAFDSKEYQRLGRLEQAGVLKNGTDTEQLRVMNSNLNEMDKLQDDNDKLLLELDKLQAELTRLATAGYDSRTDAIIDEIRTLTDDTHYYAR
jgi:hypothetical protein